MHKWNQRWVQGWWLAAVCTAGCISGDFGEAIGHCIEDRAGTLGCVCGEELSCRTGLICVDQRCVEEETGADLSQEDATTPEDGGASESDTTPTFSDSSTSLTSSSEDTPSLDDTSTTTSATSTSSDDPMTDTWSCTNNQLDGDESDVDCGGSCPPCELGKMCNKPDDCQSQQCTLGICTKVLPDECQSDADCGPSSLACHVNHCNAQHKCELVAVPDGTSCNDADPCTIEDACVMQVCGGKDGRVWADSFVDGGRLWATTSGKDWQGMSMWGIGPAKFSDCDGAIDGSPRTGEDPATDASFDSVDANNMLAGTLIGKCVSPPRFGTWQCLVTPTLELPTDRVFFLNYKQHRHFDGFDPVEERGWRSWLNFATRNAVDTIIDLPSNQSFDDQEWMPRSDSLIDVPQGEAIRLGFCFGSSGRKDDDMATPSTVAGWSIDDVVVGPAGCFDASKASH